VAAFAAGIDQFVLAELTPIARENAKAGGVATDALGIGISLARNERREGVRVRGLCPHRAGGSVAGQAALAANISGDRAHARHHVGRGVRRIVHGQMGAAHLIPISLGQVAKGLVLGDSVVEEPDLIGEHARRRAARYLEPQDAKRARFVTDVIDETAVLPL
jgi:hypothetical protein